MSRRAVLVSPASSSPRRPTYALCHMSLHSGEAALEEFGDELAAISEHASSMSNSSERQPLLEHGVSDSSVNMVSGAGALCCTVV